MAAARRRTLEGTDNRDLSEESLSIQARLLLAAMAIGPVRSSFALSRRSLADQVTDALTDLIVAERLQDGDSLPSTAELSERFGVSRTVVREAIAALAARGVLSRSQGRECVVATPGTDELSKLLRFRIRRDEVDLRDILDTRLALETMAARLAAHRAGDKDKKVLAERLEELAAARTEQAFHEADVLLHRSIAEASGNRLVVLLLDALVDFLGAVRRQASRNRKSRSEGLEPVVEQHRRIVRAVTAGKASAAEAAMREHIERARFELDHPRHP